MDQIFFPIVIPREKQSNRTAVRHRLDVEEKKEDLIKLSFTYLCENKYQQTKRHSVWDLQNYN